MTRVYEYTTWMDSEEWKAKNTAALAAGKAYKGTKFSVGIGTWGTRTFLVFAETKEEAKALALEAFRASGHQNYDTSKINCRNVTNCKKYN